MEPNGFFFSSGTLIKIDANEMVLEREFRCVCARDHARFREVHSLFITDR